MEISVQIYVEGCFWFSDKQKRKSHKDFGQNVNESNEILKSIYPAKQKEPQQKSAEQNFCKLSNNAFYAKTWENVRNMLKAVFFQKLRKDLKDPHLEEQKGIVKQFLMV